MDQDAIEPLAIIGLSVKFPQDATTPDAFWEMLREGRSAASRVPADRFNVDSFYHPDPARLDSFRVTDAHFLKEDPRAFDASFFNMSAAEASVLDPQQRGLLESSYHCLENAGLPLPSLVGSNTAVFVACFGKDYDAYIARDIEAMSRYHATGSGSSMLANRISHAYDLRGPSITVDTACSAGLSAFHLACQSVLHGESDMALVAAGNTYMTPESLTIPLDDAGFLSPDGRCYSFDVKANGYARGEGFGAVLVKPLRTALRDGNLIRAVVRATGANQDGRTPVITQPSAEAQIQLIHRTYAAAGLDLATTAYVEAHGTGTPTGDPIEASSIGEAFGAARSSEQPLYIGSVKSNIGHLEGASGLAGIIKTVLVLENGIIPPICNFEAVNPAIDHEKLRLAFPKHAVPWPTTGLRRASVSSFGYGGSNGHAILEDAGNYLRLRNLNGFHKSVNLLASPDSPSLSLSDASSTAESDSNSGESTLTTASSFSSHRRSPVPRGILPLSAGDEDGPARLAATLRTYLDSKAGQAANSSLADILHTLCAHRTQQPWRTFAVIQSIHDLTAPEDTALLPPAVRAAHIAPSLHFVFTGQGAQWARMGLGLMHLSPFRHAVEAADAHLQAALGCEWSLLSQLACAAESSTIGQPAFAQPLTTALQVALVDLVRSWGVVPASVVGHSSGEIAAAYCAGALSREEAWAIAYYRGVVSENLLRHPAVPDHGRPQTGMMSVGLSAEAAQAYVTKEGVADRVTVACINSPINVTLSGRAEALDQLYERLEEDELFVRRLAVKIAYHHHGTMSQAADEYERLLNSTHGLQANATSSRPPQNPVSFYSSVTGEPLPDLKELRKPSYWVRNLINPVQFSAAIGCIVQDATATTTNRNKSHFFVELGPQAALRRPVQDSLSALLGGKDKWHYASLLDPKEEEMTSLLSALGQLWCAGVDVDLARINKSCAAARSASDDQKDSPLPLAPAPAMVPDLPPYPFSRARLDWAESRLSKRFAFRPHRRHALLGLAARDWNAGEASWRHIIRAAENPWIMDHTINGTPLYPGAGMIVMAIEGARQLITTEARQDQQQQQQQQRVLGYRVADVRFLRSITVDNTERGVEAQLHMRERRDDINNTLQKWYDWRVFTLDSDDEWREAARGAIKVETETTTVSTGGAADAADAAAAAAAKIVEARHKREGDKIRAEYEGIVDKCKFKTYPDQLYGNIRAQGMDYGPYFARLTEISYSKDGQAAASVRTRDYAEKMQYASEDPCVIHPTTLDALCHLQIVSVSAGGLRPMPAMMFTHCSELWVSHELLQLPGNPRLVAASAETMRGFRERESTTVALHTETREPMVIIRGERGTAITSLDHRDQGEEDVDAACYQLSFRPDLSLMTNDEAYRFLMDTTFRWFALPNKAFIDNVDALALQYVEKTLRRLEENAGTFEAPTDHLVQYIDWMKRFVQNRQEYTLASRGRTDITDEELMAAEATEPTQQLVHRVGQNLYDILTGRTNALQILFEGRLMQEYYSAEVFQIHCDRVGAYIEILSHANPYLKILEVGAGTGSSAAGILPHLTHYQGDGKKTPRISEYMYTDISPGFFEKAQERFRDYASVLKFKKLDLENEPLGQGFEEGAYDVVVAGNVLHATSNLTQSLRSVRRLLKPGGKFVMVEICNPHSARENFIFGLLSGWWMRALSGGGAEDFVFPNQGPLLTEAQWTDALRATGFSGVDLAFRDHEMNPYHRLSTLVATAVVNEEAPPSSAELTAPVATGQQPIYLLSKAAASVKPSQPQIDLAASLERHLRQSTHQPVHVLPLDQISGVDLTNAMAIVLLEVDASTSILHSPTEDQMSAIKHVVLKARRVVWVTSGGGPQATRPEADLSLGFARTVCTERGDQGVVVVNLHPQTPDAPDHTHSSRLIAAVMARIDADENSGWAESELAEVEGVLHVPRVTPNGALNDVMAARTYAPKTQTCTIGPNVQKHISLSIKNPGLLDTLYFKEVAGAGTPLEGDEVEIQVKASSMNFKDVMIALGQIPSHGFGYDAAGIVTRTGPRCKNVRVGDRVMFVSMTGAFSTFVRTSELLTQAVPDTMSFTVAAAIPVIYSTVVFSLDHIARLRKGETILIHSAAGGVGQTAIMVAKQRLGGVQGIYVTVSSEAKRKLLTDLYGIPPDHMFQSRDTSFVADVMHATGGRGVDVVLNSLGGELLQQSWKCIKTFGRFVEIGKADILQKTGLNMEPFERNATFSAVDMYVVVENAKETMKEVMNAVMELWAQFPDEVHEPRPLHVYPASQFEEAMRYLQTGKNIGKTVIDWSEAAEVEYQPMLRPAYQLRPDATYLLAGGLGGLSREMIRWMMSRGARYFLCLSRSGAQGNAEATKFIDEVKQRGATIVAPACNIADREALSRTLAEACATDGGLPPIRGCIQGAMVLHDELVKNMTAATWKTPLEAKYHGSHNLATALAVDELDFFVMLSSFAGVNGNGGQSNYAAGNTYQDALARHLGATTKTKAVTVDLGLILEAGLANSNLFFVQSALRAGFTGVTQEQFLALLDAVCDPAYAYEGPAAAQVMHIVDSPRQLWEKGDQSTVAWMSKKPMFRNLHRLGATYEDDASNGRGRGRARDEGDVDYLACAKAAASVEAAADVVVQGLVKKLAKLLSLPEADLDPSQPCFRLGVDSLIAVEVRYWFLKQLGVEVTVLNILKDQSLSELCYSVAVDIWKPQG